MQQNVAIPATKVPAVNPNWEKIEHVYTGDDLIDAFLIGKEAGKDEHYRILLSQFKENVQNATELSEELMNSVLALKINPVDIRIKADDITSFKTLFIVDKKDFLDDSFREVYTLSRGVKNKSETEKFYISFSFTPSSAELNEDCLIADGFFLKYDKK